MVYKNKVTQMGTNGLKKRSGCHYIVTQPIWILVLYFPKRKFGNELLKGSQE